MEGNIVISLIITFVIACVVLFISTSILGNVSGGFDCKNLQGYKASGSTDADKFPTGTWSGQCHYISQQAISAQNLLVVILIIIAAAAILFVVRNFV